MKKIYDKVRSLRRYQPSCTITKKPTEDHDVKEGAQLIPVNDATDDDDPEFVPDGLEDTDDEAYPPTISSVSSTCVKKFRSADVKTLKKLLGNLIRDGPRSKYTISSILNKTATGREFLKTFGISTIVNRAKYEKKIMVSV